MSEPGSKINVYFLWQAEKEEMKAIFTVSGHM